MAVQGSGGRLRQRQVSRTERGSGESTVGFERCLTRPTPHTDENPCRVEDTQVLSEALLSHFAMTKDNALSCHKLRDYARAGLDGIVACLPLHRQRPGQGEAFELDLHKSLADNLLGKTVVEFPVVHVGLKGQDPGFALVRGDARGGEGQPEGPEST